jgi:hypothetical protein
MKLILPLSAVPVDSKVTFINGTKEYTVVDEIIIHNDANSNEIPSSIQAKGVRFLRGKCTTIAYSEIKEVCLSIDNGNIDNILNILDNSFDNMI